MSLIMVVTDAGRAALINAENTGTLPLTIEKIAVGGGMYTPLPTQRELQSEVKKLTTFGGGIVTADTMHITIRDESTDSYSLGEFGLITDTGVLFAVYSQSNIILDKSASGILLLAVDTKFVSIDVNQIEFGSTDFMLPPATHETKGLIRLATEEDALLGEDAESVMTPATNEAHFNARTTAASRELLSKITTAQMRAYLNILEQGTLGSQVRDNAQLDARYMSQADAIAALAGKANAAHTHTWAQVTGAPAQATRWPTWAEVTSKPTSFTPASHTHTWAQVTGQPATATRWPTFAEVSGKPTTYAPSSHTHPWSQVTGQPAQATRWPTFAEVTGKPTNYATTWGSVASKPAQATRWPTWSEVTSKPTSFPTGAKNHTTQELGTVVFARRLMSSSIESRFLGSNPTAPGSQLRLASMQTYPITTANLTGTWAIKGASDASGSGSNWTQWGTVWERIA